MADPQPQLTSDQAFDFQEEFLEQKKQNTFQERRKEGRTKNSRSSYAVYVIGGFSVFFNFISIAFPYWRSSWVAVIGYGHRRHWGLFVVQGRFSRPHHLVSDIACKHFGETMLGSTCTSPLCRWYRLKCHTYYNFMLASYICAFFYIVAQILFLLVFRWMIKLEPRSIRYANLWVKVAVFFSAWQCRCLVYIFGVDVSRTRRNGLLSKACTRGELHPGGLVLHWMDSEHDSHPHSLRNVA